MDVLLSVKSKSDGTEQELRCAVNGGITLGRSPQSPVALNGTGISRDHVRFEAEGGGLAVTDLSSNGTWVNGNRIPRNQPVALKESDCVELPGYEIRFQVPREETAVARPSTASGVPARKQQVAVRSWKSNPASRYLGSFTRLERFVMIIAGLAIALAALAY